MIARHWRGIARAERADDYINHLRRETLPELAKIDGFVAATVAKRSTTHGTEFLVMTIWRSRDAIRQFAGAQIDDAVVPPDVRALMIEYDRQVLHYEVVDELTLTAARVPRNGPAGS